VSEIHDKYQTTTTSVDDPAGHEMHQCAVPIPSVDPPPDPPQTAPMAQMPEHDEWGKDVLHRVQRLYARAPVDDPPPTEPPEPSQRPGCLRRTCVAPLGDALGACTASLGGCIQGCAGACFIGVYGHDSAVVYLHRGAGGVFACALAGLARCWLVHSAEPTDALAAACATFAMIMLNTGSAFLLDTVGASRQVRVVVAMCYLVMFVQWSMALWPSGDVGKPECTARCCRYTELVYGVVVVAVSTVMFFAESALTGMWTQYTPTPTSSGVAIGTAVSLSVLAMFLLVAGGTLAIVAFTIEKLTLLVPWPYVCGIFGCYVVFNPNAPESPVLRMWGRFIPAWTYCVAVLWPAVLWDTHVLGAPSTMFAAGSAVCILASGRIFVATANTTESRHGGLDLRYI